MDRSFGGAARLHPKCLSASLAISRTSRHLGWSTPGSSQNSILFSWVIFDKTASTAAKAASCSRVKACSLDAFSHHKPKSSANSSPTQTKDGKSCR
jgi:hypothetical protein